MDRYVKFVDGKAVTPVLPLAWEKTYTETYADEETGEERTSTWTDSKLLRRPNAEQYADMGYLPCRAADAPTESAPDGQHWDLDGDGSSESDYDLVDGAYLRRWVLKDNPAAVARVRKWTRLTVINALDEAGLWEDAETLLGHKGLIKLLGCNYILENNPIFTAAIASAKEQFGEDTVAKFLDSLQTEP